MRRLTVLLLSLALLGLAYAGGASPASAAKAKVKPTPFAFYASGFGTKLIGGDVPADSAKTAGKVLSCTNLGNIRRGNNIADATVPGTSLSVGAATTALSTIAKPAKGLYASVARETIADITLIDTPLGSASIKGLTSTARTESRKGKLNASTKIDIGRITFQPAGGLPAQTFPAPSPQQPVTIPGLVTLELGRPLTRDNGDVAKAFASSLKVTLIPSNTKVTVGNARARIERGVRTGIFSGFAAGLRGTAVDDNVKIGRNPLLQMPCVGTKGKLEERALAGVDLGGQVDVGALEVAQRSNNRAKSASGFERANVADISLADGALQIDGIFSKAQAKRVGGKVTKKATSGVARIIANGEAQELPSPGDTLEIPGLASITPQVVTKSRNGIEVIGLRIQLVEGDLATVDLAVSRIKIGKGVIRR
ncbi:choice-of-anchor P family protein [Nocardioides sp. AX2bis]|uniref:choice-of-anchor P family protein n=1 Tax=Nocardioides sp. AX2bis TaxID=2653157 RepID=UPI0012F3C4C1|nr:choice-of-anchor P family protein [Nocardioides sp. AX2bis]VXC27978.1 conserved exported hypothetical protein [Nocardioides sp. AX2bis]